MNLLQEHTGIVEIIFAVGMAIALVYSITAVDNVTTGTIIGAMAGYLKGKTS